GEQMTRALIDIARDADLRASLVRSGLETIKARHTCTHRVDELLAIAGKLRTEVLEPVLESAA
ncbi:MAG: glycosyltransferase family protein, partial [Sphingomicrobium sp.]